MEGARLVVSLLTAVCIIAAAEASASVIYGVVWSQHVHLLPAAEVELTFARCSWASTDPVDNGTRIVLKDAFQIIFDRDGILTKLVVAVMHE